MSLCPHLVRRFLKKKQQSRKTYGATALAQFESTRVTPRIALITGAFYAIAQRFLQFCARTLLSQNAIS